MYNNIAALTSAGTSTRLVAGDAATSVSRLSAGPAVDRLMRLVGADGSSGVCAGVVDDGGAEAAAAAAAADAVLPALMRRHLAPVLDSLDAASSAAAAVTVTRDTVSNVSPTLHADRSRPDSSHVEAVVRNAFHRPGMNE